MISRVLFCLGLAFCLKFCAASSGSCSSFGLSGDEFDTSCNISQYYCDIDGLCKPRGERCTRFPSCVDFFGIETAGCNCDTSGRCRVSIGMQSLFSKKRQLPRLEHDFIEYKGFVWEYGCYGTRILDMNDPLFASQRPTPLRRNFLGKSSCSYDDALLFLEYTGNTYSRESYSLRSNNCQDFAAAFSRWLLDDCTVRRRRTASDTPVDLGEYFAQLIETCSLNDLIDNTDITFVLDTSGSISSTSFQYVREFILDIVLEMNISPNNSRVAVILFDDSASLHFNLNAFADKVSLLASIENLPYSGGGTDIPAALDLLRRVALDGSLGIKNENRQIAIFLTDGQGGNVEASVAALAATNIFQVYSVGVDNAALDQLNLIALNNADSVYYHSQFTETSLVIIAESIIERLKEHFIVLQPRLGGMLGGTFIQIIGNNIKFEEGQTYTCMFDEIEVEAMYFTESGTDRIICVSPLLGRVGRIKFVLSFSDPQITAQKTVLVEDTFFSLPVQDSNIVDSDDLLLMPGNKTIIRWLPDSIVPPHLQETFAVTNDYNVDISLYRLDLASESYILIIEIANDIPNTGIYEITIPAIDLPDNFAAGVIGISLSEQFATRSTRNALTSSAVGLLSRAAKFGLVYFGASLVARGICSVWHSLEPDDIGETILNRLPPCPPSIDAALIDENFTESNFLLSFYHPGASSCFRQVRFTSENAGSGQQCCYSSDGGLIVGPKAGGTVDRYAPGQHFWQHQFHDVLPFIFCCYGLFSDCSAYYEKRPSDNGDGYDLIPPATVIGDPHIISLDGFKYTFNGKGEFLLIDHVHERFTLQGRMVDIRNILEFSFNPATVFSAVVGKQNDSDAVQFEINQQRNGIDVIVDGKMINLDGIFQDTFNNVTIFNFGNNTFAAAFSSGCSVKVKEENGFISVFSVTVPSSFKGLTRGMMGNFNGNMSDDLMARNGTESLPHDSSLEVIHNEFGISWFITKNDSLFTYNQQIDQSWETFYDPHFLPLFTVVENNEFLENICENNSFCLYDIIATGITEIGLSTLNGSNAYDKIVQLSYPVICEPPCVQGACVINDTCSCIEGYVGERCTEPEYSECDIDVCENGGNCRKLGSSYTCDCVNGYTGLDCEIAPSTDDENQTTLIAIIVPLILLLLLVSAVLCGYWYYHRSRKYV